MLHNTFPPRSNSAPKPLTATLMQEVITRHERFLKCTCQSRLTECSHMGKANLPKNTAMAKQCHAKWFQSLLLPPSGSFNSKKI